MADKAKKIYDEACETLREGLPEDPRVRQLTILATALMWFVGILVTVFIAYQSFSADNKYKKVTEILDDIPYRYASISITDEICADQKEINKRLSNIPFQYITIEQYRSDIKKIREDQEIIRSSSKEINQKLDRLIERWLVP